MITWHPIESATEGVEGLFWLVPKTQAEFGITDTSGGDIVRELLSRPRAALCKLGQWSCLMKATHWAPVNSPQNNQGYGQ